MTDSVTCQGYDDDYPPVTVLEGGAPQAPPLDLSQSQPTREGAGCESSPSSFGGLADCLRHINYDHTYNTYYLDYTDNLHDLDERIINDTTHCSPKFLVLGCACGRKVVGSGCGKIFCKTCAPYNGMKRARRVMDRVASLSIDFENHTHWPSMIYTVFTIPADLRWKFIDPKRIRKLRCKIWKMLKTYFHGEWAIEGTHPISEDHPETFHPHLNFFWMATESRYSFLDVNRLRKRYAALLGFDMLEINDDSVKETRVDAWTHYSNKPGKIWKWCKYITRCFTQFSKWCGYIRYFGNPPKPPKKGVYLCPICNTEILALGTLDESTTRLYLEYDPTSGRAPPGFTDYNINFFCDY